ncbi:MAG: aldehyde dehydrogenase family protein [Deltaproteobacteria bacterium]|nr:aldehyde dehydrogenase family protein [Deltaproteobacteria bacterium]
METPLDTLLPHIAQLRDTFASGKTTALAWRREQIQGIIRLHQQEERRILDAFAQDMRKPALEGWVSEIQLLIVEAEHVLKSLGRWTRPERVKLNLANQPGRAWIQRQPLGSVLVIGPWNYPWQLVVMPALSAIAAGNTVMLKPSEHAPATAALMAELIPKYLDPEAVKVATGGIAHSTALLAERWDHIFFTGGGEVGRVVMAAAAKHLCPVTLELGGKSPAFIHKSANLEVSARRILWGKFFNNGQTCIAPDYLLVHREVEAPFLEALQRTLVQLYGEDPAVSPDLTRVINARHFDRLVGYLSDGDVLSGGVHDRDSLYLAPTLLTGVSPEAPVMQEEIFGPILPILTVSGADEATRFINGRDKPLALYVFAEDGGIPDRILARTTSGGACVNDVLTHLTVPELPFGGVGPSGMGAYHGRAGFETFSHRRSVLHKSTWMDPMFRYPPYTESAFTWMRRLL